MNSPAVDIAQYLEDNAVGTIGGSSGWSINVSKEPAAPNDTVTIYDTGGFGIDYDANIYQPTVQVRVRGTSYISVHAKIEEIELLLISPKSFTKNSRYVGAWQAGGYESLQYDENDRAIIVLNINLMREA